MEKSEVIAKYALKEGDTGSPEVQIALLFKEQGYRKIPFYRRCFEFEKVILKTERDILSRSVFLI